MYYTVIILEAQEINLAMKAAKNLPIEAEDADIHVDRIVWLTNSLNSKEFIVRA